MFLPGPKQICKPKNRGIGKIKKKSVRRQLGRTKRKREEEKGLELELSSLLVAKPQKHIHIHITLTSRIG